MKRKLLSILTLGLCLLMAAGCAGPVYYLDVDGEYYTEFSFADVEAAIRGLSSADDSYVSLEPETAIEGSIYVQAWLPAAGWDDGQGYYVEVCTEELFFGYRYYQARTTDVEDVVGCFSRYYKNQRLPNLAVWDDVTYDYDYDGWDDWDDWEYWDDYGDYGFEDAPSDV